MDKADILISVCVWRNKTKKVTVNVNTTQQNKKITNKPFINQYFLSFTFGSDQPYFQQQKAAVFIEKAAAHYLSTLQTS